MPGGVRHTDHTTIAAAFYAAADKTPHGAAGAFIGWLLGVMASPDMDVDDGNISLLFLRNLPVNLPVVGWLLEKSWRIYWYPYAILVPHRSPISHWPVLGTLIRAVYLAPLLWLIPRDVLAHALVVWILSDSIHFVFDIFSKRMKE